jgi:uncharacterized RDD family membrane protein YckC
MTLATRLAKAERPAGIITRALACAVDILMVVLLASGSYLGLAFFKLLLDPKNFSWPNTGPWLSMAYAMGLATVYLTFFWATSGRSIGGTLMGVRVIGPRRRVMRFAGALLRALFCVVFPIGLFWALLDRRRRSLQDIVLRTTVIYDWSVRAPEPLLEIKDSPPG